MNREAVYSALFARLSAIVGLSTASRRLKHWSDVSPADMPAAFMLQRTEVSKTVTGQPSVWLLNLDILLYVNDGGDPNTVASSVLNPLLDAITGQFAYDPVIGKQTLGGLVQYARINGGVVIDEGVLGDIVIAIIPIEILTVP